MKDSRNDRRRSPSGERRQSRSDVRRPDSRSDAGYSKGSFNSRNNGKMRSNKSRSVNSERIMQKNPEDIKAVNDRSQSQERRTANEGAQEIQGSANGNQQAREPEPVERGDEA